MSSAGLREIVGEENVLESRIDLMVYASDASMREGKASVIVFPMDTEQVRKLVRYASRTDSNITIRAGGSGLSGGATPNDSIVVDLSKMNKIIEIDRAAKTAVVQAGVVLDDLNRELEPELCFPIRPSSHSVATIGGMISTNAAGNNAIRFGSTAEWVIGLRVVDGTGKLFEVEQKDIMNFCGREGTTGIILEATIKLSHMIETKSMEHLRFADVNDLFEAVKKYRDNKNLTSIEFFNRFCAKLARVDDQNHLIIGFESDDGSVKSPEEIKKLWEIREGMGPKSSGAGFTVMEDPRVPDSGLSEFLRWVEEKELPCFGHIGLGIFHPRFKKEDEALIKEMFAMVLKMGGSVSGEHGIGLTKKEYAEKRIVEEIKALKKEYDPENILNRGKII